MVLFSSSCARLTQTQMKANRLKTSWALGTVLCASTTEPLLQGRAVLSQQNYCFQPQPLHFQKNQPSKKNKHSPYTLLLDTSSRWHWWHRSQVPPEGTLAILCSTPQACNTPSLLLHLPLGTRMCCQVQPCTWWTGNLPPGVIYLAALLAICFHISLQQVGNWFRL